MTGIRTQVPGQSSTQRYTPRFNQECRTRTGLQLAPLAIRKLLQLAFESRVVRCLTQVLRFAEPRRLGFVSSRHQRRGICFGTVSRKRDICFISLSPEEKLRCSSMHCNVRSNVRITRSGYNVEPARKSQPVLGNGNNPKVVLPDQLNHYGANFHSFDP